MLIRALTLFLFLLTSGCMCWPPIPNATAHRRRAAKPLRPAAPVDPVGPPETESTCEIDFDNGAHRCDAAFASERHAGTARLAVDVPDGWSLHASLQICDPAGWVFNIGDSPTNDGGGGDYGSTSNDAELYLRGTTLELVGNDYALGARDRRQRIDHFLDERGCSWVDIEVADASVKAANTELVHEFRGEHLLRLNPAEDAEGVPDRRWYVGLNQVVDGRTRRGSGVRRAVLTVWPPSAKQK